MRLGKLAIPTKVIRSGDTVGTVLEECVRADVGGLPFVDHHGHIQGRASIRYIMREHCIPHETVRAAHFIGDHAEYPLPDVEVNALLALPIEPLIIPAVPTVSFNTPIIKGMAIMEQYGTSYLFLVDDGEYHGIVTRIRIARRILAGSAGDQHL
jgi:CBS domain-containing protein